MSFRMVWSTQKYIERRIHVYMLKPDPVKGAITYGLANPEAPKKVYPHFHLNSTPGKKKQTIYGQRRALFRLAPYTYLPTLTLHFDRIVSPTPATPGCCFVLWSMP